MGKKVLFLILILINVFVFSSCTRETVHEHLYIDGKCECGDKEVSETIYKEISFDEKMLFKKTEVDGHYQIESSFHKIIQDDEKTKQSVPILEFSEIDEKYIGVYVDKDFMETIRMELSDSRKKAFETKSSEFNWNLHNKLQKNQILYSYYSQNELSCELVMLYYSIINDNEDICYDINNVIINRENTKVKYYELNKNEKIPTIVENYEILGLYGSRNIKVIDDLYTDDNIGKEMKVYFWIPGLIQEENVIAEEELKEGSTHRIYGYNYLLRLKTPHNKYLYTGTLPLEEAIYSSLLMQLNMCIITEKDKIKYVVLPEMGMKHKDNDPNKDLIHEELEKLLLKDLSVLATSELYYRLLHTEEENYEKDLEKFIEKQGYSHEVYEYSKILDIINKYCK